LSAEELSARCAPYELAANADPNVNREPLRWVVESRTAHKLILVRDDRFDYAQQLPPDERTVLPRLAPPPAAPPPECAAELISYRVRVGDEGWLLSGRLSGYRHPWVNREGQCVEHAPYVADRRLGRARLGEPFENETFRFTLGAMPAREGFPGVPEGRLPYMVDVSFEWDLIVGIARRRRGGVASLPGDMVWLPSDDHLYIVDTALRTVTEIGGVDVFADGQMPIIRQLR